MPRDLQARPGGGHTPLQFLTSMCGRCDEHRPMQSGSLYRLAAWPELPAAYQRVAYHRMLHQMSHQPASLGQLVRTSGLQRSAVRHFLDTLAQMAVLIVGEPASTPNLVSWLRHKVAR